MTIAPSIGYPVGKQYGRRCRVEVAGPVKPNEPSLYDALLDRIGVSFESTREKRIINPDGIQFPMRVRFRMEWQANNWTPNIGYIEAYGLAADTRKFCSNKGVPVALFAGYGDRPPLVGIISVAQVNHKHDGPDWITKFEGGDGGRSFASGHMSQSFAAGTPMAKLMEQLGRIKGKWGSGSLQTMKEAAGNRALRGGYRIHGNPARDFQAMALDLDLEHTVYNEELIVAKRGATTQEVFVIGPESGLVGTPEFASPPHPGKPQQVKVRCLLNPLLRPFSRIILQSVFHRGHFRCMAITHSGDNYGREWYTDMVLQGIKEAT